MRIGALSNETGVSVATLKYYLREGLLHPGTATAVNQADYGRSHVRRVELIRALVEAGQLRIADVRRVIDAVEAQDLSLHDAFGVAQDALVPRRTREGPAYEAARAEAVGFVERHGLRCRTDAQVVDLLADALVLLAQFGMVRAADPAAPVSTPVPDSTVLDMLVEPIVERAHLEVSMIPDPTDRPQALRWSVLGTVAFEVAGAAIRRIALEHASATRFADD